MVVEDASAGFLRQPVNVKHLIVDRFTGFRELTADIKKGRLWLDGFRKLVVLLGRVDVLLDHDLSREVEEWAQVLPQNGTLDECVITGPVPIGTETISQLQDFVRSSSDLQKVVERHSTLTFVNFEVHLINDLQHSGRLINARGLTLNGKIELAQVVY